MTKPDYDHAPHARLRDISTDIPQTVAASIRADAIEECMAIVKAHNADCELYEKLRALKERTA